MNNLPSNSYLGIAFGQGMEGTDVVVFQGGKLASVENGKVEKAVEPQVRDMFA